MLFTVLENNMLTLNLAKNMSTLYFLSITGNIYRYKLHVLKALGYASCYMSFLTLPLILYPYSTRTGALTNMYIVSLLSTSQKEACVYYTVHVIYG